MGIKPAMIRVVVGLNQWTMDGDSELETGTVYY
jgi:hypothetical protein